MQMAWAKDIRGGSPAVIRVARKQSPQQEEDYLSNKVSGNVLFELSTFLGAIDVCPFM